MFVCFSHLGTITIKSSEVNTTTQSPDQLHSQFKSINFKETTMFDQMYDNFSMKMENLQMLVALANENWRGELEKPSSPMFILSPTTINVTLQVCKNKKLEEYPWFKIRGNLNQISLNISGIIFVLNVIFSMTLMYFSH